MSRALILTGGIFHAFDETSETLATLLSTLGIDSEITSDIEDGLSTLYDFDLLVVNALRWRMQGEKYDPHRDEWYFSLSQAGRLSILEHLSIGGGLLGMHTASICFDDWASWGLILGGAWEWGYSCHPSPEKLEVCVTDRQHPIGKGLPDFRVIDEVYCELTVHQSCRPILRSGGKTGDQPLLWTHEPILGRVVYDALGHDVASLTERTHRRILERAMLWAAGRPDEEVMAR